jgi:hypothetical protein
VEGDLGKHFWLKTVAVVIGLGLLGLVGWLVFTGFVARFGVIGGLVVVFGILMVIMYRHDQKERHKYDDLPE